MVDMNRVVLQFLLLPLLIRFGVPCEERDHTSIRRPFVTVHSCLGAGKLFGLTAIGMHEPILGLAVLAPVRKERQPMAIRRPAWSIFALGRKRKESCGLT